MSLTMAIAVQTRLEEALEAPASALASWVLAYEMTPSVVLGYRRPTGAEGWPFIALEPAIDARDLLRGRATAAAVQVACGFRLGQVARGEASGLLAVDALAEAVLAAIGRPWRTAWAGYWWDAATSERVDALYQHPTYELELRIDFTRSGVA